MMRRPLSAYGSYAWLVLVALLASACATSRGPDPGANEEADALPTPAVDMSRYEDFDPSPYEEPNEADAAVEHDVPERLMSGRSASAGVATVQGFRIQIYSTLERSAAVQVEEQAKSWWRTEQPAAPQGLFPDELPVVTRYLQPYYRVRIGNFATRAQAERARSFLARQYPDAFIVPDTVTIRR